MKIVKSVLLTLLAAAMLCGFMLAVSAPAYQAEDQTTQVEDVNSSGGFVFE